MTSLGRKKARAQPVVAFTVVATSLAIGCAAPAGAQAACSPTMVVQADTRALSSGNPEQILSIFNEDATVFALPKDPESLVGPISAKLGTQEQRRAAFTAFAGQRPDRTEIVDVVEVGDIAIAKLRITNARTGAVIFFLAGYRTANCKIAALWHIGNSDVDRATDDPQRVIRRLIEANNAGKLRLFLGTFDPAVLHFRSSGDPLRIGDKPSKWNGDPEGRRQLYAAMFANGAPVQVRARIFAVGDLVVSRDVARRPDGKVVDELSIYRVSGGRITHDWLIAEQTR